jgi:hypothetical protein
VENGVFHDSSVAKVLNHDPLEQSGGDRRIPNALGIHDDDWPTATHSETWRLSTLHPTRPEQQSFALKE